MKIIDLQREGSELPRITWLKIILLGAALFALFVSAYILLGTLGAHGATDLYPYWRAEQFLRRGIDPYKAYLANEEPDPLPFIDKAISGFLPQGEALLSKAPVNTAPILFLIFPLAFFSWPVAKLIWMILNLVFMVWIIWLVLNRIPFQSVRVTKQMHIVILILFYNLSATRIAIENGQLTLLIFLLMLGALYFADTSWLMCGVLLGLALSKYSLALPLVVFFLFFKRNFRALGVAAAVQVTGLLLLSIITDNSPVAIVLEYITLLTEHSAQPGIHIGWLLGGGWMGILGSLAISVFVLVFPIRCILAYQHPPAKDVVFFHLLTVLFLWSILVVYHRLYDTVIVLFFFILVIKGFNLPHLWSLTIREQIFLRMYMGFGLLFLILPARIVDIFIPGFQSLFENKLASLFLISMLGVTIALTVRLFYNYREVPRSEFE